MPFRFPSISQRPWIPIIYLLAVTLLAFIVPSSYKPIVVAVLLVVQLLTLFACGDLMARLVQVFVRLKFLFTFLILANMFLPGGTSTTVWEWGSYISINLTGLQQGILMSSQILLVVLTTHVVRTVGDEKSFINGLRSLRVTPLLAYSLDTTLALLDGSISSGGGQGGGGGMGGGDGSGGGRGHHAPRRAFLGGLFRRKKESNLPDDPPADKPETGVLALFRALRNRDLSPFIQRINQALHDASHHAERLGLAKQRTRDVGIIGGIAGVKMAFKMIKILPGLPVLQGAKTIFFIPLYILAADRTDSRWGATIAGTIMGFIAFLNGDSRYGIFEMLKHVVPGLIIDLIWPIVRRFPLRFWILVVVGLIAAVARTSTQFAMILCLGSDNATLLVFPAFKLIPNLIAGFLSALVSYPILKHLGSRAVSDPEVADSTEAKADTIMEENVIH